MRSASATGAPAAAAIVSTGLGEKFMWVRSSASGGVKSILKILSNTGEGGAPVGCASRISRNFSYTSMVFLLCHFFKCLNLCPEPLRPGSHALPRLAGDLKYLYLRIQL